MLSPVGYASPRRCLVWKLLVVGQEEIQKLREGWHQERENDGYVPGQWSVSYRYTLVNAHPEPNLQQKV